MRRRTRLPHLPSMGRGMTDVRSPAVMVVRITRYLPRDLAASVSGSHIAACCQTAWDNGWRDPEWLARTALLGTGMANVTNAAALFTAQLRDAANTECPHDATPTPPPVTSPDPQYAGPPADASEVTQRITAMRAAIGTNTPEEDVA